MSESTFLKAALAAAKAEFRVFPVIPASKAPAIKDWQAAATNEPKKIQRLWCQHPDANIGVITGREIGLFVLDVDGEKGRVSLQALEKKYGRLPATVLVRTPRGSHHYFRTCEAMRNNAGGLGPGLDGRGDGGYVVGAGSVNDQGRRYRYRRGHSPDDVDIAAIPAWLVKLLQKDSADRTEPTALPSIDAIRPTSYALKALRRETEAVRNAPTGTRNDRLNKAAFSLGQLVATGEIDHDQVQRELFSAAKDSGLEHNEIQATFESGLTDGQNTPRIRKNPPNHRSPQRRNSDPLLAELARFGETDTDNGRRLHTRYSNRLQFVPERKEWFAFDGKIWREDAAKQRIIFAQRSARRIAKEAKLLDADRRADRRHWGQQSLGAAAVRRALEMAQPHATRSITDFDRAPWLLNVTNGTLDLRTGCLRQLDAADHLSRLAGTSYDPDAKCPLFRSYLREIFAEDKELIAFVRRFAGYTLTGEISEQCFLFCQGAGRNGKSTLIQIMQEMLGDYARSTPTDTLLAKHAASSTSNDLARLHGARMVSAIEANPNRQLDEALIKQITGGDRITARFLYAEFFEYTPEFKLWFVANHPPRLRSTDDALWRRIHVLPFEVSIALERVDPDLGMKLRSELPGILAWAVRGCQRWREIGLKPPKSVVRATGRYREAVDHVRRFQQECVVSSDATVTPSKILYERYERWCSENGERAVSIKKLTERLTDAGYVRTRSAFSRGWQGLALRE